jgi:hypothetical protein
VPLPDGAQVDILYSLGGRIVENRLWFVSRQPPVDATQLDNLALGVASHIEAQLLPFLSSELRLRRVEASDWTVDPASFIARRVVGVDGGGSADCHSANVAVRVVFKGTTDQTFPNNSNFIPGIPKDQVTLNTYVDTIRDAIFECYVNLIDAAAVFGPFPAWRWVVTSRQLDNAFRTEQLFVSTSLVLFTSPYVAPRRRRLR